MKKYSILKSFSKKLVIGSKVLAGTLGLVFGGNQALVLGKTNLRDFKSTNQIQKDSEMLDANTLIMGYQPVPTKFNVLLHNGNEPIYFFVSDSFNEREKELINEVLHYYESAFKTINPKYHFKEVSAPEGLLHQAVGKTVINFQKVKANEFAGASLNYYSLFSPTYISGSTILFNENISLNEHTKKDDGSEKQFYQTIFEEVGHTFGIGDVYFNNEFHPILFGLNNTTNIIHTNTFIQNHQFLRATQAEFTPQDYAMFQALYNTDHLKGKHSPQYIKNLVDAYTLSYFESKTNLLMPFINSSYGKKDYTFKKFVLPESKIVSAKTYYLPENALKLTQLTHSLQFEDEKIVHKVYDIDNNLIEETTYKYLIVDDVVIAVNAFFASGVQPGITNTYNTDGGAYSDFAIVNTSHGIEFVNFAMLNRERKYSQESQRNLAKKVALVKAHEPRVELLKEMISNNENKVSYQFILPEEKQTQTAILPEDKLKNFKNSKQQKAKKHQVRYF